MENEKKEFGKWWLYVLALIVISVGILTFTGAFGKVFTTAVERKVFEESYQKQAGDSARLNAYRAQLAQIDVQLSNPELDNNTRMDLKSQQAMLRVQINASK